MSLLKSLLKVRPKQLLKLAGLILSRPQFAFPTLNATRHCVSVCDELFGDRHRLNGPANAFRHALWNVLIARSCSRFSSDLEDLLDWAEKVTDWHEDTFPNPVSARIMDLHNNRVGRDIFRVHPGWEIQQYVDLLLGMKQEAVLLPDSFVPEQCTASLVYLQQPQQA